MYSLFCEEWALSASVCVRARIYEQWLTNRPTKCTKLPRTRCQLITTAASFCGGAGFKYRPRLIVI